MSQRSKKKRQKTYHGVDAAPVMHVQRYEVGDESKSQAWWRENKRAALARSAQVILALLIAWLVLKFLNVI
ncbi:MAG TPA: hypothetical protein VGS28_03540 [Candidatus Saccharimonadales bacterium]|nr:hypothetical protein [Candidatus Saccharimonadales bacterium]